MQPISMASLQSTHKKIIIGNTDAILGSSPF